MRFLLIGIGLSYLFLMAPVTTNSQPAELSAVHSIIVVCLDTTALRHQMPAQISDLSIHPLFPEAQVYQLTVNAPTDENTFGLIIDKWYSINSWCHNHRVKERQLPNDPLFSQQWYFDNSFSSATIDVDLDYPLHRSPSSIALSPGGDTIVTVVHDREVFAAHPDLIGSIHKLAGEVPGNGLDDDGNGYIDDVFGYNFRTNSPKVFTLPHPHGTSVAGILAATPHNYIGITGSSNGAKILMTTKGYDIASIIAAHHYVYTLRKHYNDSRGSAGAFIVAINASWGIEGLWHTDAVPWCTIYDLLGSVGVLTVAAAPNTYVNVDEVGDMPTTCPSEYLITVAATDRTAAGNLRSGYGPTSVDVAAPGTDILTTGNSGGYTTFSGTSAATPLVTGLIAYLYSLERCPTLAPATPSQFALSIKQAVLDGTRSRAGLYRKVRTGGMINFRKAARQLRNDCTDAATARDRFTARAFPNPAVDNTTLHFGLHEAGSVALHLLSSAGRVVSTQETSVLAPGDHRLRYSTAGLPPAVYYLRITFQFNTIILPLVIQ